MTNNDEIVPDLVLPEDYDLGFHEFDEIGRLLQEDYERDPWGISMRWMFEDAIKERSVAKVEDLFAHLQIADGPKAVEELAQRVGADKNEVEALTEMMGRSSLGKEKADSTISSESTNASKGSSETIAASTTDGAQQMPNSDTSDQASTHLTDEDLNI
ncbi:hypothetical protein M409DRAFT_17381 [Zasmidium cellare ATCC 36951]|uniref:Uncharacterized protein n=1 Tax=Zasmidium cellare ATCC 36951 TaxID=1080233 RepID=A0A6A6CYH8_ZASCE|nr:uncharacterized protein M409DRAFT_17381 [Zasmidium cellare ATCC 36951]KAF2172141.1 hypothetical protein M409DRAFT_17381 [Zasmidium cellare ATCC 36951]